MAAPDAADPMLPGPGESALSLEFGLVLAAVGLLIFFFLIWRLVRQSRQGGPAATSADSADDPADQAASD